MVQGEVYSDVDEIEDLIALAERLEAMPIKKACALCPCVAAWAREGLRGWKAGAQQRQPVAQ